MATNSAPTRAPTAAFVAASIIVATRQTQFATIPTHTTATDPSPGLTTTSFGLSCATNQTAVPALC